MTITRKNDFSINLRFAADAVSAHRMPSNMALLTDSIRDWQLPRTDPTGLSTSIGAMNGLSSAQAGRIEAELQAAKTDLNEGYAIAALSHLRIAHGIIDPTAPWPLDTEVATEPSAQQ